MVEHNNLDHILRILGIKKITEAELKEIGIDPEKTLETVENGIFLTKDGKLITKDPSNVEIFNISKKFQISKDNIFYISPENFAKIYEEFLISLDKDIETVGEDDDLNETLDDTAISKFLYEIFYAAKNRGASDIHINPKQKKTVIKMRIDGKLQIYNTYPKGYAPILANKIKSEAGMNVYDKDSPQDGKIKKRIESSILEFRVSSLPVIHGENIVMRVGDTSNIFNMSLEDLGFEKEDLEIYRKNFTEPYGMILNVGATGQGKTTTFYLTLRELFQIFPEKEIFTVEDPVEIIFDKAEQVQINEQKGLGFPEALKALLRQDPDIILVGEIRDIDTASIAIKAAMTGHLILSTLHATDTISAISRLKDLGIAENLLSTTLSCLLSQRLARKLCPYCKIEYDIPANIIESNKLDFFKAYKANEKGCKHCNFTGYKGRSAIIEILDINDTFKTAIAKGASEVELKEIARDNNFQNLWKNGLKKVKRGEISLEELFTTVKKDKIINY